MQHDLGVKEGNGDGTSANWHSIDNYLIHEVSEDFSVGGRFEWFNDSDGARVVGLRTGAGGTPANYYAATLGCNVGIAKHLTFRPELRFDYQDRDDKNAEPAFNGKDVQSTLGSNLVYIF